MTGIRLFSRPDCHLCETARSLVQTYEPLVEIETINIEDDIEWVSRYGVSIPVLQRLDTEAELFWPFDEVQLTDFLSDC
jgi:hypothetical protein